MTEAGAVYDRFGPRIEALVDAELSHAEQQHDALIQALFADDGVRLLAEAIDECSCDDDVALQAALNAHDHAELGRLVRRIATAYAKRETEQALDHWRDTALYRVLDRQDEARARRMAIHLEQEG